MDANFFTGSAYFGVALTIVCYSIGTIIKAKFNKPLFNPLLIGMLLTIGVLLVLKVDYETYNSNAKYITYLLTPATICLAVPLYEQFELLKKNKTAILAGVISGVATSAAVILILSIMFKTGHELYVSLLPKSITTAIGMSVSEELGGVVSITVAAIVVTGISGTIICEPIYKLLHITEPIAKGVALGTASHVMGTSKAMELGEVEGAMSSLSLVVAGLITVAVAAVMAGIY